MPVVLWNHVEDPMDVDKQKNKKELKRDADPYLPITETENENTVNESEQEDDKSFTQDQAGNRIETYDEIMVKNMGNYNEATNNVNKVEVFQIEDNSRKNSVGTTNQNNLPTNFNPRVFDAQVE